MARSPDLGKQRRWLELFQLWQQSQLTIRAFCTRHRLNETSFHAWRRLRFQNAIWHGFVLAGAACHYTAVLDLVLS